MGEAWQSHQLPRLLIYGRGCANWPNLAECWWRTNPRKGIETGCCRGLGRREGGQSVEN